METADTLPEVMTVTNCQKCKLYDSATGPASLSLSLNQGYNYPEVLGQKQQRLWFTAANAASSLGCASVFLTADKFYNSAFDGNRPELAVISENYVKIYVNNGGYNAIYNIDQTPAHKSTIYYSLCSVASNGTETCPTFIALGEFKPADNPFILITDIADVSPEMKSLTLPPAFSH